MSKTNLILSKPYYEIRPCSHITCTISCYTKIPSFADIDRYMVKEFGIKAVNGKKIDIQATAWLNVNDTWDETLGKRIAESKCKRKIYRFYHRLYKRLFKNIMKDVSSLEQYIDNLSYCSIREDAHIQELIKN